MQYTQRKLQRSVTEIRRSRSARPRVSTTLITNSVTCARWAPSTAGSRGTTSTRCTSALFRWCPRGRGPLPPLLASRRSVLRADPPSLAESRGDRGGKPLGRPFAVGEIERGLADLQLQHSAAHEVYPRIEQLSRRDCKRAFGETALRRGSVGGLDFLLQVETGLITSAWEGNSPPHGVGVLTIDRCEAYLRGALQKGLDHGRPPSRMYPFQEGQCLVLFIWLEARRAPAAGRDRGLDDERLRGRLERLAGPGVCRRHHPHSGVFEIGQIPLLVAAPL